MIPGILTQNVHLYVMSWIAVALLVGLILLLSVLAYLYISDISQTKHAVRRNYPVIGRSRYFFEHLGIFFRQYFFAMDREELPFNRAQRSWCYRAAKDIDNTTAFGSTRALHPPGSVFFVNCPYPTLTKDAVRPTALTSGPKCATPYTTTSLFNISGMSFGALSAPAVRALSHGAKMAGCWLNTGEGGLSSHHLEGGADLVFQIGTGKFGVRDPYGRLDEDKLREIVAHPQVRMIELKLSQGAKPGKGGIVPGIKVTPEIAAIRGIKAGEDAVSPNRHPEINCDSALLDYIERLHGICAIPVGIKTVISGPQWLDELFAEIRGRGALACPDFITIDGAEGGSGTAPLPLMDAMGMPLREALPVLVDRLNSHGLRSRIAVIASGKLVTPTDVAWALCVGADFITSARGFMFAIGCRAPLFIEVPAWYRDVPPFFNQLTD